MSGTEGGGCCERPHQDIQLCDDDGIVRSGVMHRGTDYPCTGHAHFSGWHFICSGSAHDPLGKAIAIIEDSKRTHVEWAESLERSPLRPDDGNVGDLDHHRRCIADYEHVLAVLAALVAHEGERDALDERMDALRDQVGRLTRERDEWEANEQEQYRTAEALRAENERLREAERLLRRVGGGPHQLSMVPYDLRQEVRAFLAASTPTEPQP